MLFLHRISELFYGITDIPLITRKSENLDYCISPSVHDFLTSSTASTQGRHKQTKELKNNSPTIDSYSTSVMVKKNKYLNCRRGLTLSAKRLHVSCSASASPMKSVLISKRQTRSQSYSPCKKPNINYLADNSNDHCFILQHKSIDNECILSNSSSIIASPNIFSDGVFDFTMCDQCSELRSHSLDSWMDHLGELHPVPVHWPSTRASCLNEHEKRYPYTTVVGSNKKRKASVIPRPLNSFMIFAQYLRRIVLHWFPDAPNVHISQRVGQLWKKLDLKMRDKYIDEAFRLQQLHAIEFPDYKYKPKKRARNINGVGNNIEADEYITTIENVTPSISKSMTFNSDNNRQMNYEDVKFSVNQKYFTRSNNRKSDRDYLCNHTPLTVQQLETPTIDSIVCHRNYLHPCPQINNKLNTESHQPVKTDYTNCNTTHIDKNVFISNDVNNDDIYKENKEVDETMTVLVSGDRNLEHGTYQLHKIISCQTVDGLTESLISPSLLGQGNQIKEIRILNIQSPTVQLLNKQPILCRAILCEPVKAAVIRQPTTSPIRTNSSMLSGFVLNSTANNLDFQPLTTQTTDATISSISPNLSSPIELDYNKLNSNLLSGTKLENVESSYPNEGQKTKYVSENSYRVNYTKQNDDKRHVIIDSRNPRRLVEIDEKHLNMLASHHTCTSMSSETTKLKFENDNADTVLSFNDIDTCKSGASLDDLEQITLFPSEITHGFLQTIDSLNLLSENPTPFTKSEVLDNCQQATLPTNSALCTDTLMHTNGLPSIESWIFGTSKSFQLS
ncbi:hypothetical protein MN116_002340 [Schistosoma mekongi]|uniref:Sex-determining region Y protein n=1 Tax=Schistosoma mekongi TaxID=38744 RepID=A0AAE1ZL64_SCHME|nr:hypothetical protein MN116_002340 [Schistosoma mekongi]